MELDQVIMVLPRKLLGQGTVDYSILGWVNMTTTHCQERSRE